MQEGWPVGDRAMRVAYLVRSHTNPEQIVRLVTLLSEGDRGAQVVLHHNELHTHLDRDALVSLPGVHLLDSVDPVEWGSFSLMDAVLRGLQWVLNNVEFDWLVLLSGQDYPIEPLPVIEDFLGSTQYDGFLSGSAIEELKPRSARETQRRYYYRYYRVPAPSRILVNRLRTRTGTNEAGAARSKALRPVSVKADPDGTAVYVGFRRFRTPFTSGFRCYRGGFWFTLSSKCVVAVDRFVAEHPDFVRYYQRTRNADESFLNTILFNDATLDISRDDLRYVRFPPGGAPHPDILTIKDLESMLASGKHFARKFDVRVDGTILDVLDERVHARSGRFPG
jgi:hypothetical protein